MAEVPGHLNSHKNLKIVREVEGLLKLLQKKEQTESHQERKVTMKVLRCPPDLDTIVIGMKQHPTEVLQKVVGCQKILVGVRAATGSLRNQTETAAADHQSSQIKMTEIVLGYQNILKIVETANADSLCNQKEKSLT